ncbi:AAA family ATPase [Geodermatophilus chilensis]|uniref:AAA family ATPase n=1 Tax=Geodermatophilus chilensis TaxID=2035835 RepID=UPI000C2681BE|nr:AAA family ATPase [Geodermatophilus chilensis]
MTVDYSHMTPPVPPAPTVITMSDVEPERVQWLWPGRLPLGKLVVIDGDPSTGKSTLTLDLAARVSTGGTWPDGALSAGPRDVLLLSAEDGVADTIAPRLAAAGADRLRVHVLADVPQVDEDGNVRRVPPSLPRDVGLIEKVVAEKKVAFIVVDVLMAFLNSGVDSHRDQDVRGVLHQLASMAERAGCTVVLIRHLNKAGGSNALYRGGGSIGIVGAARAAYLVARDPEDEDRRIFAVTKCNLALEPPSLAYRLVDDPDHGCARIEWEDAPVEHTAASLLRGPVDDEDRTERDEAADWLLGYLTDNGGTAARKDIVKAARAAGYSEATLKRAKDRAAVKHSSEGFPRQTWWSMPVGSAKPGHAQGEPTGKGEPTGADLRKHNLQSAQSVQSAQPSASEPTEPTADCGHPIKAVNTSNGKCGQCIAERPADPARAAAEEHGRALRLAVGA